MTGEQMTGEQMTGEPIGDRLGAERQRLGEALAGNRDLLDQVRSDLDDVDAALRRLEEGTYGRCEACGQPIGETRLEALPAARYCLRHEHGAGGQAPPRRAGGGSDGGFPLDRVL